MHINTKLVMGASAVIMATTGVVLLFFPQEISTVAGIKAGGYIFMQLLGALYFGFAALNWMAKDSIIGGIYAKPVVTGNLAHFVIGGLALVKNDTPAGLANLILGVTIVYCLFALIFGYIMFTHPSPKKV